MATQKGWNIDKSGNVAVDFTEDVTEHNLVTAAGAVAGAGDHAAGIVSETLDISVFGARGVYHTKGNMVGLCAAAVTDLDVPLKPAAAGTVTPATTDQDDCVGWPKALQPTVGGEVEFEWRHVYYAT
jgi:hypothetical protein